MVLDSELKKTKHFYLQFKKTGCITNSILYKGRLYDKDCIT